MMFGHFTGYVFGAFVLFVERLYKRAPTVLERLEMQRILRSRAEEIMKAIERELHR